MDADQHVRHTLRDMVVLSSDLAADYPRLSEAQRIAKLDALSGAVSFLRYLVVEEHKNEH